MNRKEFLQGVADELKAILTKATHEEIGKLDFMKYSQSSTSKDIFGLLTGDYKSSRAREIVRRQYYSTYSEFGRDDFRSGTDVTLIDKYMTLNYSNYDRKSIFDFLKGELSTITLKVDDERLQIFSTKSKGFNIDQVKEIQI